jgi:hypothetical protein
MTQTQLLSCMPCCTVSLLLLLLLWADDITISNSYRLSALVYVAVLTSSSISSNNS